VSKAFTSEETPETGPVVRGPPRLAPGEIRYITPEGRAALEAERQRLRAAATPDAEARVAVLDAILRGVTVASADAAPAGIAAFATWVTVEEEDGSRRTWRLVGPDEADARRGLVSVRSPVGRALLGRRAGDVVEVERPGGASELTIVSISRTAP
jgi:transcription elongation factor GreB